MGRFVSLLGRFRRDERGVFAVFFAIIALVLIATAGAVVDFTYVQEARTRAQTAIDAAALALQTRISTDSTTTLKTKAQSILTKQMADTSITATVDTVTTSTTNGTISITARVTVPTAFIRMVGINSLSANLLSEVTRGSKNVEVAVALDITGSMAGTKLTDLQSATDTLIDLVVQDVQTPTYTKMAIVPWSNSVNGSGYQDNLRGPVTPPVSVSNVTWQSAVLDINNITKANPGVVTTSTAHGLSTGDTVYIKSVSGMTQVNNRSFTVTVLSGTTFQINQNTSGYNTYSSSGSDKVYKCIVDTCYAVVTTTSAHGLNAGDWVYVSQINGATSANSSSTSSPSTVDEVLSSTQFSLSNVNGGSMGTYTSGGWTSCMLHGCKYYRFINSDGNWKTFQVTNCVSERDVHNDDDVAPSTTYLGYVYGSTCVGVTFIPLTTSKTDLHDKVTQLYASGSTAGHIGLAWGWYLVSPNFSYLWPAAENQPAAYNANNLIKAVVLMTDGQFNVQYCDGVISRDSPNATSSNKIDCDAPSGDADTQFNRLCDNIKAQNIILYTVGFDLAGDTASLNKLQNCATDTAHFFQADTGADLATAFNQIAQSLNNLRVSK